jgi:hypothetical protein
LSRPDEEEDCPDEPPGGDEEAALMEATNETTYPVGGRGTDSSPGTFQSTASGERRELSDLDPKP